LLGCVVAGTGAALLPSSVLRTFPDRKRLSVHALPPSENRAETVLIHTRAQGVRRSPSQICDPAGLVVQVDAEMARQRTPFCANTTYGAAEPAAAL